MSLKDQLNDDLKNALRGGDKVRLQTIRSLISAVKYAEIEAGGQLDEPGLLAVVARQAKQRRDSMAEFEKGGRSDLVAQEAAELAIIEAYLPAQMSPDEIRARAQTVITELGVTDARGMGQVMKRLMADLKGQADGQVVNRIVRELLNN